MRTPAELTDRFRSRGLKLTPQRQAIFRALYEDPTHPTAEAVHAAVVRDLPMVSLRTVYQTLHELAAMGEITQIDVGTGSARFDPTLEPHHHLVCDHCHRIVDLPVTFPEVRVPAGASDGFEVRRTEIVFRGRCATCAATAEATVPNQPTHITEEAQPRHG